MLLENKIFPHSKSFADFYLRFIFWKITVLNSNISYCLFPSISLLMNIFPFKFLKTFRKFKISHPCPLSVDTWVNQILWVSTTQFLTRFSPCPAAELTMGSKFLEVLIVIRENASLGVKMRLHRLRTGKGRQNSSSAFRVRDCLRFFNLSMAEVTEISPWILLSLVRTFTALFVSSFSPTTVENKGK